MSYTQTVYFRVPADYNSPEHLGDFGGISWDTVTEVYDGLISRRLPSCLSWCGDEVLGPYEPTDEERRELEQFPGFEAIMEEAWIELCGMTAAEIEQY